MAKLTTRSLLLAGGLATVSAWGSVTLTLWNWAAANGHATHSRAITDLMAGLSPLARMQISWYLALAAISGLVLVGLGLYGRVRERTEAISSGECSELSIYRLAPHVGVTGFVTSQVLVSLGVLLAMGHGCMGALHGSMGMCCLTGCGTLLLPFLLAVSSGRNHPRAWRLAAMAAVVGVPCWFFGGSMALMPWRLILVG